MRNTINTYNFKTVQKEKSINEYASVVAQHASSRVSSKYNFIPTTRAIEVLNDHGWFPARVMESKTRIEENKGFQKHVIRFSNEKYNQELMVNDTIPQLILKNSHSGTCAFELSVGLYRVVCQNGLCVANSSLHGNIIKVRHSGYQDLLMEDACKNLVKTLPNTLETVEKFKKKKLDAYHQGVMANKAIEMIFDGESYVVKSDDLLKKRRFADSENTLWNTYNVIQENVIKGGVRQRRREDDTIIRSRAIKNIDRNLKVNRQLWDLQVEVSGYGD